MIDSIFNMLLFCSHRRISLPMTTRQRPHLYANALCRNPTFVTCLDCGKQFSYNWEEMRIEAAEPLVGFRMQRLAAAWLASARAALIKAAVDSYRFLSDRNTRAQLSSAISSGIETVASVWYLQPATFRDVLRGVQLRLRKRRRPEWPDIATIQARIQVAMIGLKKIVNTAVHDVNLLVVNLRAVNLQRAQQRFSAIVGTGTVKSPPPSTTTVGSGGQPVNVQAHPRLLFATESQIEFLSRLPRGD